MIWASSSLSQIALHDAFDRGLRAHRHEDGSFDDAVRGVDAAGARAGVGALGDEFKMHYFTVREESSRDRDLRPEKRWPAHPSSRRLGVQG